MNRELRKLLPDQRVWEALDEADQERLLRASMRELRSRIRKGPGVSSSNINALKFRDRHARTKSREAIKRYRRKRYYQIDKRRLVSRYRKNEILDGLHPTRKKDWIDILDRPRRAGYPALSLVNFSFLDNPDATLKNLRNLSILESQEVSSYLHFDDKYVNDIGSFLVLSEIWPAIRGFAKGGRMEQPVQRVLKEMGVGDELNIRLTAAEDDNGRIDIWTMPVQRRHPLSATRANRDLIPPQTSDIAATRFGDLVNSWLRVDDINAELTPHGLSKLKGIFGELLDNAVRHSLPGAANGNWSMGAFMARRKSETSEQFEYICRMAVLSPGLSIAETFAGAAPRVAEFAELYAERHANQQQSKDTLKTLLAIQDMITTDAEAFAGGDGGTGMMETIKFFNALASVENAAIAPKMTIVSGASCVMLRTPYIVGITVRRQII